MIGLGNPVAGDDGVGFAVVEALRGRMGPSVALLRCADPAQLVDWLGDGVPTVLVDAVRGEPPGRVLLLGVEELAAAPALVSSHGVGVAEALALAGVLWGALPPLWVVGVTVSGGLRMGSGLSPEVVVAVDVAVKKVTEIVNNL